MKSKITNGSVFASVARDEATTIVDKNYLV